MGDVARFCADASPYTLRPYQSPAAKAIVESVLHNKGFTFVLIFSRQSGKDELLTQIVLYLLNLYSHRDSEIVFVNPTYKPQTIRAVMRLENRFDSNLLTKGRWKKRADFIRRIGSARCSFLSGDEKASVVGATASLLLIVNESQDISLLKYDKDFTPMAANTNATKVHAGTRWTSNTLLEREYHDALKLEKKDGIKRVFFYTATDVGKVNPNYKKHVEQVIKKLGRNHPLVRTQYYNEVIDATGGMFNPTRRALMRGDQPPQDLPVPGHAYSFQIDVAGQDEARMEAGDDAPLSNPARDSITLSITDIDLTTIPTLQAPTYRIIKRHQWTGINHLTAFGKVKQLADLFDPLYIVVDATGVGEGFWALLDHTYPTKVIPVKVSQVEKSDIGWRFLAIIETGRFRDCDPCKAVELQYDKCVSEIQPGPAKIMRWSVPEGTRDSNGELIHDDYLFADALISVIDRLEWSAPVDAEIIQPADFLKDMDDAY